MSQETTYHTVRGGTAEGEYAFGHITWDNELDAVMIRNCRSCNHYIALCATGSSARKEGTICRSKGSFQVKAGDNIGATETTYNQQLADFNAGITSVRPPAPKSDATTAIYMEAVNGDIVIMAPSGKIKFEAEDFIFKATGPTGESGNFNVSANNNIVLDAEQSIDIKCKVTGKMFAEKLLQLEGMSTLNLYGGTIDMADGATSVNGSKGDNPFERQMRQKSGVLRFLGLHAHDCD